MSPKKTLKNKAGAPKKESGNLSGPASGFGTDQLRNILELPLTLFRKSPMEVLEGLNPVNIKKGNLLIKLLSTIGCSGCCAVLPLIFLMCVIAVVLIAANNIF